MPIFVSHGDMISPWTKRCRGRMRVSFQSVCALTRGGKCFLQQSVFLKWSLLQLLHHILSILQKLVARRIWDITKKAHLWNETSIKPAEPKATFCNEGNMCHERVANPCKTKAILCSEGTYHIPVLFHFTLAVAHTHTYVWLWYISLRQNHVQSIHAYIYWYLPVFADPKKQIGKIVNVNKQLIK